MKLFVRLLFFLTLACRRECSVLNYNFRDWTRSSSASGKAVVDVTIQLIQENLNISQDYALLKRIASVESAFGEDADVMSSNPTGGIWQITSHIHNILTDVEAVSKIGTLLETIEDTFQVDCLLCVKNYSTPLRSALAALLFINYNFNSASCDVPLHVTSQAQWWSHSYHPGGDDEMFINWSIALSKNEEETCDEDASFDLWILIEDPGTFSDQQFNSSLKTVIALPSKFNISPNKVRVGLSILSQTHQIHFHFNASASPMMLKSEVDSIAKQSSNPAMGKSLQDILANSFSAKRSARSSVEDTQEVLIVITDSNSSDDITPVAEAIHEKNIIVFAIKIGSSSNWSELNSLVTEPHESHRFEKDDFKTILMQEVTTMLHHQICRSLFADAILSYIRHLLMTSSKLSDAGSIMAEVQKHFNLTCFNCMDHYSLVIRTILDNIIAQERVMHNSDERKLKREIILWSNARPNGEWKIKTQVDLWFMLSGKFVYNKNEFRDALRFVSILTRKFSVSHSNVQAGLSVCHRQAHEVYFKFNDIANSSMMEAALLNSTIPSNKPEVGKAIEEIIRNEFTAQSFARASSEPASRVLIVLTSDSSEDNVSSAAQKLRHSNITTISIGIGKSANPDEIRAIATDPTNKHNFRLKGYEELEALMSSEIYPLMCHLPTLITKARGISVILESGKKRYLEAKVPKSKDLFINFFSMAEGSAGSGFISVAVPQPNLAFYDIFVNLKMGSTFVHVQASKLVTKHEKRVHGINKRSTSEGCITVYIALVSTGNASLNLQANLTLLDVGDFSLLKKYETTTATTSSVANVVENTSTSFPSIVVAQSNSNALPSEIDLDYGSDRDAKKNVPISNSKIKDSSSHEPSSPLHAKDTDSNDHNQQVLNAQETTVAYKSGKAISGISSQVVNSGINQIENMNTDNKKLENVYQNLISILLGMIKESENEKFKNILENKSGNTKTEAANEILKSHVGIEDKLLSALLESAKDHNSPSITEVLKLLNDHDRSIMNVLVEKFKSETQSASVDSSNAKPKEKQKPKLLKGRLFGTSNGQNNENKNNTPSNRGRSSQTVIETVSNPTQANDAGVTAAHNSALETTLLVNGVSLGIILAIIVFLFLYFYCSKTQSASIHPDHASTLAAVKTRQDKIEEVKQELREVSLKANTDEVNLSVMHTLQHLLVLAEVLCIPAEELEHYYRTLERLKNTAAAKSEVEEIPRVLYVLTAITNEARKNSASFTIMNKLQEELDFAFSLHVPLDNLQDSYNVLETLKEKINKTKRALRKSTEDAKRPSVSLSCMQALQKYLSAAEKLELPAEDLQEAYDVLNGLKNKSKEVANGLKQTTDEINSDSASLATMKTLKEQLDLAKRLKIPELQLQESCNTLEDLRDNPERIIKQLQRATEDAKHPNASYSCLERLKEQLDIAKEVKIPSEHLNESYNVLHKLEKTISRGMNDLKVLTEISSKPTASSFCLKKLQMKLKWAESIAIPEGELKHSYEALNKMKDRDKTVSCIKSDLKMALASGDRDLLVHTIDCINSDPMFLEWQPDDKEFVDLINLAKRTENDLKHGNHSNDVSENRSLRSNPASISARSLDSFSGTSLTSSKMSKRNSKVFPPLRRGLLDQLKDSIEEKNLDKIRQALERIHSSSIESLKQTHSHCSTPLNNYIKRANDLMENLLELEKQKISVNKLRAQSILDVRNIVVPPGVVHNIFEATYILLGYKKKQLEEWTYIQTLLGKSGKQGLKYNVFVRRLVDICAEDIAVAYPLVVNLVVDDVREVNATAAIFLAWAQCVVKEHDARTVDY